MLTKCFSRHQGKFFKLKSVTDITLFYARTKCEATVSLNSCSDEPEQMELHPEFQTTNHVVYMHWKLFKSFYILSYTCILQ